MTRTFTRKLAPCLAFATLVAATTGIAHADSSTEIAADAPPKIEPPDWAIMTTPLFGWLDNTTTVNVKVPSKDDYIEETVTLSGDGWGTGLMTMGFYKRWTLCDVLYYYPNVNSTRMWGNIVLASTTFPTGTFAEPFVGGGFAYVGTDSLLNDFTYTMESALSDGTPTIGYAHFGEFAVDTRNVQVFPEVGVKLKIPIQQWYVRPYYQYMYEHLNAHAHTRSGRADVYRQEDGFRVYEIPVLFDKENVTVYRANVVGTAFGLDLYYFLRLQGSVYYNIDHDLLSTRLVGSVLFSRYVGLSAYFEYQDMIIVDNTYFMLGLTFMKMPSKFFDSVNALIKYRAEQG
jgi:hypothetical protein